MFTCARVYAALFTMLLAGVFVTTATAQLSTPTATTTTTATPTVTPTPTTPPPTELVEWDISDIDNTIDGRPGAITVDIYGNGGGRVWFVTREGVTPRVFMFQPGRNLKYGSAQWKSWTLDPGEPTGGLKKIRSSYDRRFVFVRTMNTVQKIDTQTDLLTTYAGLPSS